MLKNIIRYIAILSSSSYTFKLPKKKKFLIYDPNEKFIKSISYYLPRTEIGYLHVRGELLNIPILFISLFSSNFFYLKKNYITAYINFTNPKLVLTATDNDMVFFTLKKTFEKRKIIFIMFQNGLRGIYDDYKEYKDYSVVHKNILSVDYFLTISSSVIKKYKKYIQAKYVPIGLIANNLVIKKKVRKKNQILFISQFKSSAYNSEVKLSDKKKVKGSIFYKSDQIVLNYLMNFIKKNSRFKLVICLRPGSNYSEQKKLITSLFNKNTKINFFMQKKIFDNYREIDKSAYIISLDSTLGYEAYARGSFVGFFSIRGTYTKTVGTNFGWPAKLVKKDFWSNKKNIKEFDSIMNFIMKKKSRYISYMQSNRHKIMEYDKGNLRFKNLLRMINAPIKE